MPDDAADGLEELRFQWSSPQTVNPADPGMQEIEKKYSGAFEGTRRFPFRPTTMFDAAPSQSYYGPTREKLPCPTTGRTLHVGGDHVAAHRSVRRQRRTVLHERAAH
ncbi:MAG TPA: hypothetical protein VMP11_01645 [Verrucomicrobiae bacterium]|nr:hypothetical protein [Verrucomicrobiae bacterium]